MWIITDWASNVCFDSQAKAFDEFEGEYTVYCHKEDIDGSHDSCYELAGTEKEVMQFLSSRGIDDSYFFGLRSYYDLR